MAELVFDLGRQNTKRIIEPIGLEQRVVTKTTVALFIETKLSFDGAMRDVQDLTLFGQGKAATKTTTKYAWS